MNISTITPVRYHKSDGVLFRDLDRIHSHIKSILTQNYSRGNINCYIGDFTEDQEIAVEIENICSEHGAKYLRLSSNDVFNRGKMINEIFMASKTTDEFIMLYDMDLVVTKDLFERFYTSYLSKENWIKILVSGINFISLEKLNGAEVNSDLLKYGKQSEQRRFSSANGLQFMKTEDFLSFGGLDENFDLYCGTDDEILNRANYVNQPIGNINDFRINKNYNDCLAFHLNHSKSYNEWKVLDGEKEESVFVTRQINNLFCSVNRFYLANFIEKGSFRYQNNLNKEQNYFGVNEQGFFYGTKDNIVFNNNDFKTPNEELARKLLQEYIKNKG